MSFYCLSQPVSDTHKRHVTYLPPRSKKNEKMCFSYFMCVFPLDFCKGRHSPNTLQISPEASQILPVLIFSVLTPAYPEVGTSHGSFPQISCALGEFGLQACFRLFFWQKYLASSCCRRKNKFSPLKDY